MRPRGRARRPPLGRVTRVGREVTRRTHTRYVRWRERGFPLPCSPSAVFHSYIRWRSSFGRPERMWKQSRWPMVLVMEELHAP